MKDFKIKLKKDSIKADKLIQYMMKERINNHKESIRELIIITCLNSRKFNPKIFDDIICDNLHKELFLIAAQIIQPFNITANVKLNKLKQDVYDVIKTTFQFKQNDDEIEDDIQIEEPEIIKPKIEIPKIEIPKIEPIKKVNSYNSFKLKSKFNSIDNVIEYQKFLIKKYNSTKVINYNILTSETILQPNKKENLFKKYSDNLKIENTQYKIILGILNANQFDETAFPIETLDFYQNKKFVYAMYDRMLYDLGIIETYLFRSLNKKSIMSMDKLKQLLFEVVKDIYEPIIKESKLLSYSEYIIL